MTQHDTLQTLYGFYGGHEDRVPPQLIELVKSHPDYIYAIPQRPPWRWRELSKESLKQILDMYTMITGPEGILRASLKPMETAKKNARQREVWEDFLGGLDKLWRKTKKVGGRAIKSATRAGVASAVQKSPKAREWYQYYATVKGAKPLTSILKREADKEKHAREKEILGMKLREKAEERAFKERAAQKSETSSPVSAPPPGKETHIVKSGSSAPDYIITSANPIPDDGTRVKKTIERFHATRPIRKAKKEETFPVIKDGDWVGLLGKLLFICYRSNREDSVNPYFHGFNNVFEKGQNNNVILQAMDRVMSEKGNAKRFVKIAHMPRLVIHSDLELFSIEAPLKKVAPVEAAYFSKHAEALASGAAGKVPELKTLHVPDGDDIVGIVGDCLFVGWLDPNGHLRWHGFDGVFVDGDTPHPILAEAIHQIIADAQAGSRRDEWLRGPSLMATSDQNTLLFLARMSDRGIINEDTQWLER